jgi:adenylate cyclase
MTSTKKKNNQEIKKQVERICNSAEFGSKKRLCRFLQFIVEETLSGREAHLKGYSIATTIFDRDKDFDPEHDPIVRIQAGRLRRSLEVYYLSDGRNDPIHIVIPKGRYVPKFLPVGVVQTSLNKEISAKPKSGKKSPAQPSIAVLPFKNLTGDPEKEYYAQGFSEELSFELTHYEDLTVIACRLTSQSAEFLKENRDIATNLNVHFLLDGSVSLNNDQITILIKLIDGITNEQVWAERYRRDFSANNLVHILEDIACETARLLGSEYGIILHRLSLESQRRKPKKLDSYEAILRFYYYEAHHTNDLALEAFQALEQALARDPECGVTTAMLASLYGTIYMLDLPNSSGALQKMSVLAEKSVKLDPNSQIVRIIYASKLFASNEKARFFEEAENCLAMNLNAPFRIGILGFYLSLYGDWERGKALLDKAMNYTIGFPLYFYGATTLYYYKNNDYEKALHEALHYNIPALFWAPMLRAAVLGQLNQKNDALNEIQHLKTLKPEFKSKAYYLISRYVKEEDLVEHIIEGLQKAGLKINNIFN